MSTQESLVSFNLLMSISVAHHFPLCTVILTSFTFTLLPGSWAATRARASLLYLSILITHCPQNEEHGEPPILKGLCCCSEIPGAAITQTLNLCTSLTYPSQREGALGLLSFVIIFQKSFSLGSKPNGYVISYQ